MEKAGLDSHHAIFPLFLSFSSSGKFFYALITKSHGHRFALIKICLHYHPLENCLPSAAFKKQIFDDRLENR